MSTWLLAIAGATSLGSVFLERPPRRTDRLLNADCASFGVSTARAAPDDRTFALDLRPSVHPLPPDIAAAAVHLPRRGVIPSRTDDVAVFLHGWNGCARALLESGTFPCGARTARGMDLARAHDESGFAGPLVIPQLAFLRRSSDPGRLRRAGFFLPFLRGALASAHDATSAPPALGAVHLIAHSGGYAAAREILADPAARRRVRSVVLLDALYGDTAAFAGAVLDDPARRLVSLYTGGTTRSESGKLARHLARRHVMTERLDDVVAGDRLTRAIRTHRVVLGRTRLAHGALAEELLSSVLRALGSDPGDTGPP